MWYSESTKGWYDKEDTAPVGSIKVEYSKYLELMHKEAQGEVIAVSDEGEVYTFIPEPPKPKKEDIEIARLRSYSDPVYGSDRYFSEAYALQAEGFSSTSTEVKEVKLKGINRKQEIKNLYPWPEDGVAK